MFILLDNYLLLSGVKINITSITHRVVNLLFYWMYTTDIVISMVAPLYWNIKNMLMLSSHLLFLTSALFTQQLLFFKRTQIEQFMSEIRTLGRDEVRLELFRVSRKILVVLIVINSFEILNYIGMANVPFKREAVDYYWTDPDDLTIYHRIWFEIRSFYVRVARNQWMSFSALPYVYLAIAIELIKQSIIEQYAKHFKIHHNSSISVLKQLLSSMNKIESIKQEFDQLFGIFPLLWFQFIFFATSGIALFCYDMFTQNQTLYASSQAISFTKYLIVPFLVIFIVNHQTNQTKSKCEQLANTLTESITENTNPNVTHLIRICQTKLNLTFNYTAYGLFELNNGLLLSFGSGLLSFTVMFLQLSSSSSANTTC